VSQKGLHITLLVVSLFLSGIGKLHAQNINLETALQDFRNKMEKGKKFKLTGSINASNTYSYSTMGGMRDPFVYAINGTVNVSWMTITIPVSLNFTNAGFSYSYKYPRLPNRLGLHPKYKIYQAHIGDFSMNFSPYTMSGFQITGAGFDIQPKGNWKYSGFYGRFQKAVPYIEGNGNTLATYKRNGLGAKISYAGQKIQSAISFIRIDDKEKSLLTKPDSLNIFPKSNLAVSIENKYKLTKSLQIDAEIGLSAMTNDRRAGVDSSVPFFHKILKPFADVNASTSFYKAFKANLTYSLGSSSLGLGYERIDPGYQTLGAYYFNNDLENITANFAQQLFNKKVNVSVNTGIQKDDLKKEKTGSSNRVVMAVNTSITGGKKFNSSFNYSNFQSFTNVKPQFQYINQLTPYDNLDTLDFRQLSQNANANLTYIFRADSVKTKMLNVNLSFQDSHDEQGGIVSTGNSSQFYNLVLSYSTMLVPKNLNFSYSLNATYNTIGVTNMITAGPSIMIGTSFFDKKLRSNLAMNYNLSMQQKTMLQQIASGRINASYTLYKKHQLGLSSVFMYRVVKAKPGKDFSTSITYSYSF
jgi:hypothetical protein